MTIVKFWKQDRKTFPGVVIPLAPSPTQQDEHHQDSDHNENGYDQTQSDNQLQEQESEKKNKNTTIDSSIDPEKGLGVGGRGEPNSTTENSLPECTSFTIEELKAEILNDHANDANGSLSASYDSMI